MRSPGCPCGGCDYVDDGTDDGEEYVTVRFGRPYLPWEAEVERACGIEWARHRVKMRTKGLVDVEVKIYKLEEVS